MSGNAAMYIRAKAGAYLQEMVTPDLYWTKCTLLKDMVCRGHLTRLGT